MRRRQFVELGIEQLTATFAALLMEPSAKHTKLAQALTHADYTLQTLNAHISRHGPTELIDDDTARTAKQMIAESVNMAIVTRTNVMLSPDKNGRRYRLQSALIRFLLLRALQNELTWYAQQAVSQGKTLQVNVDGAQVRRFSEGDSGILVNRVLNAYTLHPFQNMGFTLTA